MTTSKKLSLTNWVAIAFGLLPALCIVGMDWWHAFFTSASADYVYALIGLLLTCAIGTIIYLPYITDKVSYGKEYGIDDAFLWTFAGMTILMICYGIHQANVTGWLNPVIVYETYVGAGIITAFWVLVIIVFGFKS